MSGKQSVLRTIVNRNVERQLVKEFLMENTKTAGFGGLTINRTPNGTSVEIRAEKPEELSVSVEKSLMTYKSD